MNRSKKIGPMFSVIGTTKYQNKSSNHNQSHIINNLAAQDYITAKSYYKKCRDNSTV